MIVANCLRHPFRLALRGSWLSLEFLFTAGSWIFFARRRHRDPAWRAAWQQCHARRLLRVLNVQCRSAGRPPADGFLVANHLSYLDIVVLAALCRCVFVAKQDVRGWPVFGWFAQMAGTIFVDRNRRSDTVRTAEEMKTAEETGQLVVLFPEGTSSGGEDVLPFKSPLLAPVADAGRAAVAHVSYELRDGSVPHEVAYWGDMTLLPHLLNLLTKKEITATVRFQTAGVAGADRKTLARHLREQIKNLAATAVEKL